MANFIVDASDIKPPIPSGNNLDHRGFRRCGQYEGTPPASAPAVVNCGEDAIGRYVYIYVPATGTVQLCEAEVYGSRKWLVSGPHLDIKTIFPGIGSPILKTYDGRETVLSV